MRHGRGVADTLTAVTRQWPTPMAGTPAQNGNSQAGNSDFSRGVMDLWPTATAGDAESSGSRNLPGSEANPGTSLTDLAVRSKRDWSTPAAHDGRRPGADTSSTQRRNLSKEGALWSTPSAGVFNDGQDPAIFEARRQRMIEQGYNGNGTATPLTVQAQEWRTPQAGDSKRGAKSERGASSGYKDQAGMHSLVTQTNHWPTPAARDHKGANSEEHVTTNGTGRMHMDQLPNFVEHGFQYSPPDPATPDGQNSSGQRRVLNPLFVELLMGWPVGWTACEPVETGLSLWLQRSRIIFSRLCLPPTKADQGSLF